MFGISWPEFIVLAVVALVAIGPDEMPALFYKAGKLFRKFRIFAADVQKSIDHIVREEEMNDIIREANKPGGENLQLEIDRQLQKEQQQKNPPND